MTMDRVGQPFDTARSNFYLRKYCVKFATRPRKFQRGLHLSCELFEVAHERLTTYFDRLFFRVDSNHRKSNDLSCFILGLTF